MNKAHAAGIALLLGAAAVFGMVAATRTAGLGRAAAPSTQARPAGSALAWRTHRLDRIQAALRRSLRSRPPKLPPIPAVQHPAVAPPAVVASVPVAAAPSRTVYQRPPPIVVVKHRAHGDDREPEGGGVGDD